MSEQPCQGGATTANSTSDVLVLGSIGRRPEVTCWSGMRLESSAGEPDSSDPTGSRVTECTGSRASYNVLHLQDSTRPAALFPHAGAGNSPDCMPGTLLPVLFQGEENKRGGGRAVSSGLGRMGLGGRVVSVTAGRAFGRRHALRSRVLRFRQFPSDT